MLYEKKKLLFHRLFWLIVLILGIVIPIIINNLPQKDAEIVEDNGYINRYYESLDETSCEIEVTLDKEVDSAYITVAFYDTNNNFLGQERQYFSGYDETLSAIFYVDGKVDSYEIIDYEFKIYNSDTYITTIILIYVGLIPLIMLIYSLFLSYKKYEYNDNVIIVYAGFYHYYIKVNGVKVDEHNTLMRWSAIKLSSTLDDQTELSAVITLTNRIALKINNQLYMNRK